MSGTGNSDAARSWGASAVLGVPPMSNWRGSPHERLHQDGNREQLGQVQIIGLMGVKGTEGVGRGILPYASLVRQAVTWQLTNDL
ncbi:hypothetical protein [Moorena sp. SIO3H5]|uniref:hypothetical protein n=1 Tax=Moorena sp. SIO3H5 TaxID=2607834 RepID=UPI0013B64332|nr:hypothetical protein [Moorena sp. SIO3H5]NEO68424.1 hypothetical protein [Moorena sp. SIO3H5]